MNTEETEVVSVLLFAVCVHCDGEDEKKGLNKVICCIQHTFQGHAEVLNAKLGFVLAP